MPAAVIKDISLWIDQPIGERSAYRP